MKRLSLIIGIGTLFGCGGVDSPNNPTEPGPDHTPGQKPTVTQNPNAHKLDLRPMPKGQVLTVEGFVNRTLAETGKSPVAASTEQGLFYGYIDVEEGWPALIDPEGQIIEVPRLDTDFSATSLSMASSIDGALNLVFELDTAIIYIRRNADGTFEAPVTIESDAAKEPTIALSPMGAVIVAYTYDVEEAIRRNGGSLGGGPDEPARIMVARGLQDGDQVRFENPVHANPECCVDALGDRAYFLSGPSLAVDQAGAVHLVYEWMTNSTVAIEYITDATGNFETFPLSITDIGFFPCPAIGVDADGVHITYLEELQEHAWYVRITDGDLSEPRSIYQSTTGHIYMAMMVLDGSGQRHFSIHEQTWAEVPELRLLYITHDEDENFTRPVTMTSLETNLATFTMTPRAGGALVTPEGQLLFGFERQMGQEAPATPLIVWSQR